MDEEIQYLAFHPKVREAMDKLFPPAPPGPALESYRFIIMDASEDSAITIIEDISHAKKVSNIL